MRAISQRMLSCSCTLYHAGEIDEDRQPTWEEPITLTKIWITSSKASATGSIGKESTDIMQITYDVFNSRPLNQSFSMGDKIVFNDTEYYINSIKPVYKDGLSHYIIGLK